MDRSFGSWLCNLGKLVIIDVTIPLAKYNLPGLVNNLPSNAVYKFERKIIGKRAVRTWKGFILITLNEDMDGIIKFIKTLEDLGVLTDRVTERKKHEIKKQESGFLGALWAPLAASLVQPVISSVLIDISGAGIRRAGMGYIDKKF